MRYSKPSEDTRIFEFTWRVAMNLIDTLHIIKHHINNYRSGEYTLIDHFNFNAAEPIIRTHSCKNLEVSLNHSVTEMTTWRRDKKINCQN